MSKASVVSVVIPVTSPDLDLKQVLEGYSAPLRQAGYDFDLVFVIDGVRGAVVRELEEAREQFPIKIVRLQGAGLGESIALSAGAARARGDLIINAPQYLQCDPEDILKVVTALESGADFVATWRAHRVDPWLNRLQSRFFNWCLRVLMGVRFHDLNSSLRGMRRQVIEDVNVYGDLYRFLPVLAMRQGFKVVEVKVRHREEKGRQGIYGLGVYFRRALDIIAISFLTRFTQKPLRFFGPFGAMAILLGLVLAGGPLWDKMFADASLQDHPRFVLGMIMIAFGAQLVGFGLVGEIIIFTQASNLRDYKVDEVIEGGGVDPAIEELPFRRSEPDLDAPRRVRELLPGEDARWDSFVRRHAQGTFFHLSGWRRCVQETFGHVPHDFVVETDGAWRGVLPSMHVRSVFVGEQLISQPYAVYGGLLADDAESEQALVDAACELGRDLGVGYLELRQLGERTVERQRSDLYRTYRKALPKDPAEVLPAIPKRARAEVRRARDRHEMRFEPDASLEEFYQLFAEDKRRLGSPTLPFRWFVALREEFGRQVYLHQATDGQGRAAAIVMSFAMGKTLYAYYSGARVDSRGTGVNNFIYCRIMEWAVENGFEVFDFGRSRHDSGAAAFKHNMGFEGEPLHYEYEMLREGATIPEFHPSNPALSTPRKLWARLPRVVTDKLGGRLSRYLP